MGINYKPAIRIDYKSVAVEARKRQCEFNQDGICTSKEQVLQGVTCNGNCKTVNRFNELMDEIVRDTTAERKATFG